MLKAIKNFLAFLVYSNLYIAACAVLMVQFSAVIMLKSDANADFTKFVFFSTLCSYNFHYYFTTHSVLPSERIRWMQRNRYLLLIFFATGLAGALYFFIQLSVWWAWLLPAAAATFLYSAPLLPHPVFRQLRKIAIGKTIFLAFIWMYVTAVLPLIIYTISWNNNFSFYAAGRFFFIYCICILFDYRDRADDKAKGVRSLITFLSEKNITRLFVCSFVLYVVFTLLLHYHAFPLSLIAVFLIPGLILAILYPYTKRNFSDMLYYVVLDGLLALPALLMMVAGI